MYKRPTSSRSLLIVASHISFHLRVQSRKLYPRADHMSNKTYYMSKETYQMSKETYHVLKETYPRCSRVDQHVIYVSSATPFKTRYGVATISRLLKLIGLFRKRALSNRLYSAQETLNFKEPTNRSHPIEKYEQSTCQNREMMGLL